MRELILSDASVALVDIDRDQLCAFICDAIQGVAKLISKAAVDRSLRLRKQLHEVACYPDLNLLDLLFLMQRDPYRRDHAVFVLRLAQKFPLLEGMSFEDIGRFHGCEAVGPLAEDTSAMLCALTGNVLLSVPASSDWDTDLVAVEFLELDQEGEPLLSEESADNISRSAHAELILGRHFAARLDFVKQATLWQERVNLYPNLEFCPGVEDCIRALQPSFVLTVARRLAELDSSASEWKRNGGSMPRWHCKVTPESDTTMQDERLRRFRVFTSVDGEPKVFEWHARYGSAGRIHLRFEPHSCSVEIGYIGEHLPLK